MLFFPSAFMNSSRFSYLLQSSTTYLLILSTFILFVMAGQASRDARASVDAETPEVRQPELPRSSLSVPPVAQPKGAGPSDNSTSLTAPAQESSDQKTARQSSFLTSNTPPEVPGKENSSEVGDASTSNSHNVLQNQNESQPPQDLIEQKSARIPSLPASPAPVKAPSIVSFGNVNSAPTSDSNNVPKENEESQKSQGLQKKAREPSLPISPQSGPAASINSVGDKDVSTALDPDNALGASNEESRIPISPTSGRAASIKSAGNKDVSTALDSENVLGSSNEESRIPQTARQPSLPISPTSGRATSIKSVGNKDVSAALDSDNELGASGEESRIPQNLPNQKTPSQPSVLFSPRQLEAANVDSSSGANPPDTTETNSIPADSEELQKPQELSKRETLSQFSPPLSPISGTDKAKRLNNANSRKSSEIPGSWPVTSEASSTAQDLRKSETPSNSLLPLSHIPNEDDGVETSGDPDASVGAELAGISRSPKPSLFSPSTLSFLSKFSDQETVRSLEPGTEERTNVPPSIPASLGEGLNPPSNVESGVLDPVLGNPI